MAGIQGNIAMDKLRVLVVDDKKVIGDLFDFTLGYSGHQITVVDNAMDALNAIRKQEFDVAFLDIVMPGKDGVEVLQDIRGISPKLPIIMMSGYSVEDKRLQATALGAVTCLKKPFEMEDVKKAIKAAIGREI